MSKQILFGLHAVKAALNNPRRRHKVLYLTPKSQILAKELPSASLPPVKVISVSELEQKIPPHSVHQQIVLETSALPSLSIEEICENGSDNSTLVILDQITDPHNVGAILRSCAAFYVEGLIITSDHSSNVDSSIIAKTASGALEVVPIIEVTNLASTLNFLKTQGFWCYGLDEAGASTIREAQLSGKVALIMGAEGKGLRRLTKERCDELIKLPTNPSFPTLNVSNALAISLYEKQAQSPKA